MITSTGKLHLIAALRCRWDFIASMREGADQDRALEGFHIVLGELDITLHDMGVAA